MFSDNHFQEYRGMSKQEIYQSKKGTLQDALDLIQGGDCIHWPIHLSEPKVFLDHIHTIAPRLKEIVTLWHAVGRYDHPVLSSLDEGLHMFRSNSFFYDGPMRKGHPSGRNSFFPMNLHSYGDELQGAPDAPNVYVAQVSAMDEFGFCHVATDLQWSIESFEKAKKVIFEVNDQLPQCFGECALPIERADVVYEVDTAPYQLIDPPMSEEEKTVAGYVSELSRDGDCIQLGFGGIPNAIGMSLLNKWDLGIHTEQFSSSMARLVANGNVTNARKAIDTNLSVAAFAIGDDYLYKFIHKNPRLFMRRGSYTNDPMNIAKNDNVLAINGGLQYDLTGQIASEGIGHLQYSGTGGATDFAYGAYHSKGGRGVIASTATTKGGTMSRIVPVLQPGSVVTVSRNLADHVVTEYGIAKLRQRTVRQRVENLIAVAHPDFRAELRREASKLMYC